MKIGINFPGFKISSEGLRIQRKRMNLIAENIANADITRTSDGQPYKRKFLEVISNEKPFSAFPGAAHSTLRLNENNSSHIGNFENTQGNYNNFDPELSSKELVDPKPGDKVYMPDNPNADADGYVQESNVNIVTEMVDMISASRSYQANLTAFNSSKQMVKDSLEI